MSKKFVTIFGIFAFGVALFGNQPWQIKAPDSLQVGTIFSAELLLPGADAGSSLDGQPQVAVPVYDTLEGLSLLGLKLVPAADGVKLQHQFIFTSGGLISLPELQFEYQDENQQQKKITSQSYPFVVHSLLDTTVKDISDIRPPISVFLGVKDYLVLGFCLLILVLLGKYLPHFWRKKQQSLEEQRVIDDRPAWQVGLDSLASAKKFLDKGELLDYFFALSFALRFFLERSYSISATQMTTDELRGVVRLPNMSQHNKLFEIFAYADLVKFAKYAGDISLARDYYAWAHELFLTAKKESQRQEKEPGDV